MSCKYRSKTKGLTAVTSSYQAAGSLQVRTSTVWVSFFLCFFSFLFFSWALKRETKSLALCNLPVDRWATTKHLQLGSSKSSRYMSGCITGRLCNGQNRHNENINPHKWWHHYMSSLNTDFLMQVSPSCIFHHLISMIYSPDWGWYPTKGTL